MVLVPMNELIVRVCIKLKRLENRVRGVCGWGLHWWF